MKEETDFSKYEDDIIILLNKLSSTIETFKTLSRDQAEKAILETNSKLNDCKEILDKMEQYVNDQEHDEEMNKAEINKKILNYKSDYNEILNKYNEIQNSYINKKTESALLEKENNNNLVDEDEDMDKNKKNKAREEFIIDGELIDNDINYKENKKELEKKKEEVNKKKLINKIDANNNNQVLGHNNSQALNYSLNPKIHDESDEAFNQLNKDYFTKKKKTVLICLAICILIFVIIILSSTLSRK